MDYRHPGMGLTLRGEQTDINLDVLQGTWSEEQYLRLTAHTNRMIEFTDGVLEFLHWPNDSEQGDMEFRPGPTRHHQAIIAFLYLLFLPLMRQRGGAVYFASLRVRVRPGEFREPDLLLLLDRNDPRNQNDYWRGADLVVEVVSPDAPARDTVVKRWEYAAAAIPEYWIVNPAAQTVTVLQLAGTAYAEHGVFPRGAQVSSPLLPEIGVPVDAILDAE